MKFDEKKKRIISSAMKIPGLYEEEELNYLFYIVYENKGRGVIIELGSLFGRSLYVLCEIGKGTDLSNFYDTFNNDSCYTKFHQIMKSVNYVVSIDYGFLPEDIFSKSLPMSEYDSGFRSIRKMSLKYPNLISIIGDSSSLSHLFLDSISILHIDADHSYKYLKKTMRNWWTKINVNGFVLFHDYGKYEVTNFVDNLIKQNKKVIQKIGLRKSLIALKKKHDSQLIF